MKCRNCGEALKDTPTGIDFSMMFQAHPKYCENSKCKEFGYVTMVGIQNEDNNHE